MFLITQNNLQIQLRIPFSLIFSVRIQPGSFPDIHIHNITLGQINYLSCAVQCVFLWLYQKYFIREDGFCRIDKILRRFSYLNVSLVSFFLPSFSLTHFFFVQQKLYCKGKDLGPSDWANILGLTGIRVESKNKQKKCRIFAQGAIWTCDCALRLKHTGSIRIWSKAHAAKRK